MTTGEEPKKDQPPVDDPAGRFDEFIAQREASPDEEETSGQGLPPPTRQELMDEYRRRQEGDERD